jgi:hypothetical protein
LKSSSEQKTEYKRSFDVLMEYVLEIDRNIQLSAYGIRELQHLSDLKDARKKAKIKFTPYVDAWAITKTKKGRTKEPLRSVIS